ncbi:MAG: hypothetical protein HN348_30305 [Proteobacteria bacterium]|nr:hypothetical protein [Pseudomonadota bacterium]
MSRPTETRSSRTVIRDQRRPESHGQRPSGATRPYTNPHSVNRDRARPPHRAHRDHRYARPTPRHVRPHPHAHYRPPTHYYYRPYYTRWYVHPYYRYHYSTSVVVNFGFVTMAWYDTWIPPHRAGWSWSPGYWDYGYWHPGYWRPIVQAPVHYVYVPGWWDSEVYVDGYYRPEERDDGDWEWVEGYYLEDGTFVRGHWMPLIDGPEGYGWEPGFWDGEDWVEGFWRPEYRPGYTWISSYYDEDGIYYSGYWMPYEDQAGYVWVPGWFDGNEWVVGYWVRIEDYESADLSNWEPEEGWNDGWEVGAGWGDGEVVENHIDGNVDETYEEVYADDMPLGIPVVIPEGVE